MGEGMLKQRIRDYFVEFSKNPRVMVSNPDSPNDFRTGRVIEITPFASIKVAFESGPGDAIGCFERYELETIREGVDIKIPKEN